MFFFCWNTSAGQQAQPATVEPAFLQCESTNLDLFSKKQNGFKGFFLSSRSLIGYQGASPQSEINASQPKDAFVLNVFSESR